MPPFAQAPTPAGNNNEEEPDYEQVVEKLIAPFPPDLQEVWRNKYYDAEDPKQLVTALRLFIDERKKLALSFLEMNEEMTQEMREEVIAVVESIRQAYKNETYFLGNGATAEVYTLPIAPHLCTKYIVNQKRYNEGNHMREEFEILTEMSKINSGNVRTPKPAYLNIHPSEGHSYGMERIDGASLSVILEKKQDHHDLIGVAKGIDQEQAVNDVLSFVREMHKRNYIHGDLFQRNMMIDKEGKLFVIDFGKAKEEQIGEDRDDEKRRELATVENEIRLFFKGINEIDISGN